MLISKKTLTLVFSFSSLVLLGSVKDTLKLPSEPSSTYSVLPTALSVSNHELRLSNINLLANSVEYGVSDHFSIRALFELFNPLFASEAPTLSINPKLSFTISKELHIATDFIFISAFDDGQLMIPHGVATLGSHQKNISLGVGYVFDELYGASASYLGLSFGGTVPISPRWSLVSDNWILLNGDVNVGNPFNFLSISARTSVINRYHLDFGIFYNTDGEDFGRVPWPIIKLSTTLESLSKKNKKPIIDQATAPPPIVKEEIKNEKLQQEIRNSTGIRQAIYGELLGTGGIYSINYDRRFKASLKANGLGIRVGVAYFEGIGFMPIQLNYLIGKNHFLELGIGTKLATAKLDIGNGRFGDFNVSTVASTKYRYQSKDNHLFFSLGIDLFMTGGALNRSGPLWPSVALGFSF